MSAATTYGSSLYVSTSAWLCARRIGFKRLKRSAALSPSPISAKAITDQTAAWVY